ncbi:MAG: hypothetical protein OJF49_000939 [Ktedonobacterales bacterium]|jgi:uncharacterized membrane protein YciS (DUF1049 family)|nr:MAG: hypothetical protein OJF49_000939 [Ktedonobacterales bacterium]
MASTKMILLGILIMLVGLGLVSATTQIVAFRVIGADSTTGLAYLALGVFVADLIVGVVGFFRKQG